MTQAAPTPPSTPDMIDRLERFAVRASAWLEAHALPFMRFGSPENMAVGGGLAALMVCVALVGWPAAEAPAAVRTAAAPATVAMTPVSVVADPVAAPPPPPVQIAFDYDVAFYWPKTPQTVAEAVAIREGPATYAKVLRSARPGERLRINGRVDEAPGGPWLRVRLADGTDGFLTAEVMDMGAFRRRRVEERAAEPVTEAPEIASDATGAPLMLAGPSSEPEPSPSF